MNCRRFSSRNAVANTMAVQSNENTDEGATVYLLKNFCWSLAVGQRQFYLRWLLSNSRKNCDSMLPYLTSSVVVSYNHGQKCWTTNSTLYLNSNTLLIYSHPPPPPKKKIAKRFVNVYLFPTLKKGKRIFTKEKAVSTSLVHDWRCQPWSVENIRGVKRTQRAICSKWRESHHATVMNIFVCILCHFSILSSLCHKSFLQVVWFALVSNINIFVRLKSLT